VAMQSKLSVGPTQDLTRCHRAFPVLRAARHHAVFLVREANGRIEVDTKRVVPIA
jgi:hypothetical protein